MSQSVALAISCIVFLVALCFQLHYFRGNRKKLKVVRDFFKRNKDYEVCGVDEDSQLNPYVAESGSGLRALIVELNRYTKKNHGTTDFSIIQNKTERKVNMLYDNATSRIAFPTYIGLMGTFLGVFLGLLFFTSGLGTSSDGSGITDETIGSLITGVLVSMSTSFIGLLLTTITHHYAAWTQKVVREEKNEFFEFIQNELMPTLGVSMVAALNKLHQTINLFEPSFNRVIERFQTTFDSCTQRFGSAFEQNVTTVSDAVRVMGENMDKINENVDLQAQLLKSLRSRGVLESLNAFVSAAQKFDAVTKALNRFETARDEIKNATVELVNCQRRYNESLETPLKIANKLNQILARVTDFEKSINALGRSIEKTDLIGNTEIEALKQAITAIKKKQKIAVEAMDVSDGHLKNIFDLQSESIKKLGRTYEESFASYAEKFQSVLAGLEREMVERRREIVAAIEDKFSLEQIQHEFSQLGKLSEIEKLLSAIKANNSQTEVVKAIEDTRREVVSSMQALKDEAKKNSGAQTDSGGGRSLWLFGRK